MMRLNRLLIIISAALLLANQAAFSQNKTVNVKLPGADGIGHKDISIVLQKAIDDLALKGGGDIYIPQGLYLLKYTVFVPSNIGIKGSGKQTVIKANISIAEGRCAFLVGDSYEINRTAVKKFITNKKRGWPNNPQFEDVKLFEGLNITAVDKRIITRNSSIQNLCITFDYTGCKNNWGGYGIQFSNAANCFAKDIWTSNACQAVGIGSDTPPATPACVNVFCYNIHVLKPDFNHTYYSIGFISNSNNCGIIGADSYKSVTANSDDGSLIAINVAKNCVINHIRGTVGRSKTSEGVFINNAYGCTINDLNLTNAKKGLSISFTDYSQLQRFKNYRNLFSNISISDSEYALCVLSKYNSFKNFKIRNCQKALVYNINATDNIFVGFDTYLSGLENPEWFKSNNLVKN